MREMDERVSYEALAEQIGEGMEECMQVAAESQGRLEQCLHRLRELDVPRIREYAGSTASTRARCSIEMARRWRCEQSRKDS